MSKSERNSIINKIKEYLPNEKIQIMKHEGTNDNQIFFTDKKAIMTILEENTWDEIKRHIDSILSNEKSNECSICYTNAIIKRRVTCTKCASDCCIDCFTPFNI
jgi:hypothetical protein